jgi:hypothetical protein
MSEYWKSTARYQCPICNIWMQNQFLAIRAHESGKHHQQNLIHLQRQNIEKNRNSSQNSLDFQKELARIEREAKAKVQATTPSSVTPSSPISPYSSSSFSHIKQPPPPSLPPNSPWNPVYDPNSQRYYFYHATTRETTWQLPNSSTFSQSSLSSNFPDRSKPLLSSPSNNAPLLSSTPVNNSNNAFSEPGSKRQKISDYSSNSNNPSSILTNNTEEIISKLIPTESITDISTTSSQDNDTYVKAIENDDSSIKPPEDSINSNEKNEAFNKSEANPSSSNNDDDLFFGDWVKKPTNNESLNSNNIANINTESNDDNDELIDSDDDEFYDEMGHRNEKKVDNSLRKRYGNSSIIALSAINTVNTVSTSDNVSSSHSGTPYNTQSKTNNTTSNVKIKVPPSSSSSSISSPTVPYISLSIPNKSTSQSNQSNPISFSSNKNTIKTHKITKPIISQLYGEDDDD